MLVVPRHEEEKIKEVKAKARKGKGNCEPLTLRVKGRLRNEEFTAENAEITEKNLLDVKDPIL